MANVNHKEIISILEEADRWLTFEELYDKSTGEHDFFVFQSHLDRLVAQGKIQYIPYGGMEPAYYGRIGLEGW